MSDFNWNDHPVVSATPQSEGKAFSWDDHPIVNQPQQSSWKDTPLPGGTAGGYVQGALDTLPYVGMAAGGLLGTPADVVIGPAGNVVGAGIGASAGTALKKAGERFILGKNESNADVLKGTAAAIPEGMANEIGGQILGKGLSAAAGTKAGQAVISKAGKGAARVGEMFTGVPQKEIETYAEHGPAIDKLSAENDHNSQDIADAIREKMNGVISSHKAEMNSQISKALADKSGSIDAKPILEKLDVAKGKINAKLRPDEVGEVDELIGKVNAVSKDGKMTLQDAHDLKEYLAEQAKGTYQKNGAIFQRGEKAAQAAKAGAATTRDLLNTAAPEVAEANGSLSRLHDIEDTMNKSLLSEGKTASPLMSAGSGQNQANEKILKQLGKETGTDVLGEAQKLAAARTFGKPQLMPVDSTGKAVGRMGLAAGAGFVLGGPAGAATAAAVTSPAALKVAMNAGRGLGKVAPYIPASAIGKAAGKLIPDVKFGSDSAPKQKAPEIELTKPTPTKGPDKWANDGIQNLIDHSKDAQEKADLEKLKGAAVDRQTKDLLIQASDLKPKSKAMEKILSKVKTKIAGSDE